MKKVVLSFRFAFLVFLFLGACASRQVSVPVKEAFPIQESSLDRGSGNQSWEQQWKEWVGAGKKEGKVVIYSASGSNVRDGLAPRFFEKYGVEIDFISAKGGQLTEKIATERRAGLYIPDIYIGGSTTIITQFKPRGFLDLIEPLLLLPEVKDTKVWVGNQLSFIDKDRMILSFTAYPNAPLGLNTNLVKAGDIKSYNDLLLPRWKGKLLMNDPTVAGTGAKWYGVVSTMFMGLDFMRQLARQEPVIIQNLRIQLEWLAQGRYSILIVPHSPTMQEFREAGAPVTDFTPVEGTYLTAGSGNVALINRAGHPNAARVFINWLLTKEAGLLWQKAMGQQSARMDVPPEFVDPTGLREEGVKYVSADNEEFLLKQPEQMREAREIFGHLMR